MTKEKNEFAELALVLQKFQPIIKENPDLFFDFISTTLKPIKISETQREQSNIKALKIIKKFEEFKTLGEKANKPIIGLVDCVFDMIHFGHFNALRQASLCCDELIVGINSDKTVEKHKG